MSRLREIIGRVPLLVWFIVPTFIVVGVGVWFLGRGGGGVDKQNPDAPLAVSHAVAGTVDYPIVSRTHIDIGKNSTNYNSNPPTSGDHWPNPGKNGMYDQSLPDEQLVHDLEHGYVWISYKSDVSDDDKNKLKKIVEADNWKVILEPRDMNDSKIALAAWGRLLKMDNLDEQKVKDFISTYRNRAPERTTE